MTVEKRPSVTTCDCCGCNDEYNEIDCKEVHIWDLCEDCRKFLKVFLDELYESSPDIVLHNGELPWKLEELHLPVKE